MTNLFNDEDNVLALEELMYILFIFASFISDIFFTSPLFIVIS
jgi:hypothetical protein